MSRRLSPLREKNMSKNLTKKLEIAEQVEELMLKGMTKPVDFVRAIPDITDYRIAKAYIKGIRDKWSRKTLDLEQERTRLILQSEEALRDAEERIDKITDSESMFLAAMKNAARNERIEQKKLLGLDEKRFILSKDNDPFEGISQEERHKKMVELLPDKVIEDEYNVRRNRKTLSKGIKK